MTSRYPETYVSLKAISLLGLAVGLAGCDNFNDSIFGGTRANLTSQYSVLDANHERIDLVALLAGGAVQARTIRKAARETSPPPSGGAGNEFPTGPSEVRVASIELSMAYQEFYARTSGMSELAGRRERNRVQDQVFNASQLACTLFKRNIRVQQQKGDFLAGAATTVLGGLGAIFTSASTARALAGSAGITSGVGAEFRQAHFANLAAEVITAGIDAKRSNIYDQIDKRRHNATEGSLALYSMENAIHDAIRFHAACSIDAGFQEAKDSIQLSRNPGLAEAGHVIERVQNLRAILQRTGDGSDDPASADGSSVSARAGGLGASGTAGGMLDLGLKDVPLTVLTGFRQRAVAQTQAIYKDLTLRIDRYREKTEYKGAEKDSAFAKAMADIVDPVSDTCRLFVTAVDAGLDKDKSGNHSIDIAKQIAILEGGDGAAAAEEALSKLRKAARQELILPLLRLQETWDIETARLRTAAVDTDNAQALTNAAKPAVAMLAAVQKILGDEKIGFSATARGKAADACSPPDDTKIAGGRKA